MSVIIQIDPVETITEGGEHAFITGIDMNSGDPLNGYIVFSDGTRTNARWGLLGNKRDGHPKLNLDMEKIEMKDLIEVARSLGARLTH